MKVAFIGSSLVIQNPCHQELIEQELSRSLADPLILIPSTNFNAFIKTLAEKRGIRIEEMDPPKAIWLGLRTVGEKRQKCRELYGYYLRNRAERLLCFAKKGSKGPYRPIIEYLKGEIPLTVFELD